MCACAFPPWLDERERKRETFHGANGGRTLASHGLPRRFPFFVLGPHVKICRRTWGVVTWENLLLSFPLGFPLTFFTSSPCLSLFPILTPLFPTVSVSHPFSVALLVSVSFPLPVSPFLTSLRDDEMTLLWLFLNLVTFSSCLCIYSFCIAFFFYILSRVQCTKKLI